MYVRVRVSFANLWYLKKPWSDLYNTWNARFSRLSAILNSSVLRCNLLTTIMFEVFYWGRLSWPPFVSVLRAFLLHQAGILARVCFKHGDKIYIFRWHVTDSWKKTTQKNPKKTCDGKKATISLKVTLNTGRFGQSRSFKCLAPSCVFLASENVTLFLFWLMSLILPTVCDLIVFLEIWDLSIQWSIWNVIAVGFFRVGLYLSFLYAEY